jgi:putative ABC transport system permease protein
MGGILHIAYKLLVNDRAKYAALLVGITFAVFLMIEMTSLFAGILTRSSATVINIGASIWVMDPAPVGKSGAIRARQANNTYPTADSPE